jgi:uncharacterized protein (DUF1015 family)
MSDVRPFRALRPRDDLAGEIIAPPYDVLTDAECRALARAPRSFVHVTRSEVDLPEGADPHGDAAYAKAAENLVRFVREGWLVLDDEETFYLYAQSDGDHRQVAVLGGASVAEYDDGRIARHEHTRPDKEDDRTRHLEALDAQVGLVFLAYAPTERLAALVAEAERAPAAWRVRTEDGVIHALRPVPVDLVPAFRAAFAAVPRLYVCDGHHRSAAAARVAARRRGGAADHFLAGLFPADQLRCLAYNRLVTDLAGLDADGFWAAAAAAGWEILADAPAAPAQRGDVSVYLAGGWRTLRAGPRLRTDDPVRGLDVSLLQDHLLGPILGIDDPRRATRIQFVGGARGTDALRAAVDRGEAAVAFSMYPTGLDQLFRVADAGAVMPPKSTWFEPKLREGVAIRLLS